MLLSFLGAPCSAAATSSDSQMAAVRLSAGEGAENQSFSKFLLARESITSL